MGKAEAYVEDYLVKECKKRDILCWKFTCPGTSGVPDRICIANGHIVFVETKAPKGVLRKLQQKIIDILREHGACVYVAYTREQVDQLIADEF